MEPILIAQEGKWRHRTQINGEMTNLSLLGSFVRVCMVGPHCICIDFVHNRRKVAQFFEFIKEKVLTKLIYIIANFFGIRLLSLSNSIFSLMDFFGFVKRVSLTAQSLQNRGHSLFINVVNEVNSQ